MECSKCNNTGRVTTERRDSKGRVIEQRSHICTACDSAVLAYEERARRERTEAREDAAALEWALRALGYVSTLDGLTHKAALRRLLADAESRAR